MTKIITALLFLLTITQVSHAERHKSLDDYSVSCLNCDRFPQASSNTVPTRIISDQEMEIIYTGSMYLAFSAVAVAAAITEKKYRYSFLAVSGFLFKGGCVLAGEFYKRLYNHLKNRIGADPQNDPPKSAILFLNMSSGFNMGHLYLPHTAHLEKSYLVFEARMSKKSHIGMAIDAVRENTSLPISAIVIDTHGTESSLALGKETIERPNLLEELHCKHFEAEENSEQLGKALRKLDPTTLIILNGCKTAANENFEEEEKHNIAQLIALLANGRKVFASSNSVYGKATLNEESLTPHLSTLETILLPLSSVIDYTSLFNYTRCYQKNQQTLKVERCN